MRDTCQSCEALMINGVYCHETGCPDSWRDYKIECKFCGDLVWPEDKGQKFCGDSCVDSYYGEF